jgi:hypothetical protein
VARRGTLSRGRVHEHEAQGHAERAPLHGPARGCRLSLYAECGESRRVGHGGDRHHTDIVLVQVRTRDWPSLLERAALTEFRAPPNARKLLHRWKLRARWPDEPEL